MRKKLDDMAIKLYGGARNQVVGVPHLKWGSTLISWNNAVEGEVNDYRLAGGCVFRKTFSQPLVNLIRTAFWVILEGCLFLVVSYDMSKLDKMKEDIDHGLPAVGKLIDEVASDLPKKVDSFFNSVADGFEKFFTH